jgi:hypothetical protein
VSSGDYVVDIKPSARRANGVVGATVHQDGGRRSFEGRESAESWATGLSVAGTRKVWIRRANPDDRTGADAYLVSRRPRRGDAIVERTDAPGGEPPGEQAGFDAVDG